ncbi:MAG: hypothetical protein V2A76_14945, partial [Planctomycetota bacterium]
MRRLPILIALLAITGCGPKSDEGGSTTAADAGGQAASEQPGITKTFGAGVSEGEITPISAILANPDVYVNKTV